MSIKQIIIFISLWASVEIRQALGFYSDKDIPKIEAAKTKMLKLQEKVCEMLTAANKEFEAAVDLPEPE